MTAHHRVVSLCLLVAMCCGLPREVHAAVPHLIRFQGQAVDSKGIPLEGPYTLTFRLYDAQTAGTKLWEEAQANVPISGGHFSVLLGQVTPLNVDWSQSLWLSVQVGTDPELSPRQQITSVPLALRSEVAEQLTVPVTTSTITDDANKLVPSGAIILWDGASCPTGYTRLATYDSKHLVGGAVAGLDQGTDTQSVTLSVANLPPHTHTGPSHTHSIPAHTHTILMRSSPSGTVRITSGDNSIGPIGTQITGNPPGTAEGGGTTSAAGADLTSSTGGGQPFTFDNRPAGRTVLLCKKG